MAITFGQILTDALTEINQYNAGDDPDPGDIALALTRGNALLDSWNARSRMQFVQRLDSFPFVTSKQDYTIGPVGADFTADRPVEILQASIVMVTANPHVFIPLYIATAEEWASFGVLDFQTSIPATMWYEPRFPNGIIHLRGIPDITSYELRILTSQQLGQAASVATQFIFPPGYYLAFMYTLAEILCNPFGKTGEIKADITRRAKEARALVISPNGDPANITLDGLNVDAMGPYWNWLDNSLVY